MAEFYPPQFQNPDFLGQYLRGQQGAEQAQAFPGAMQLQQQQIAGGQQELQKGALTLQQLQLALRQQQTMFPLLMGALGQGTQSGSQSTQTGQQPGGATDTGGSGVTTGPQGAVAASPPNAGSDNYGFMPNSMSQQSREIIGALAPNMLKGIDEGDKSALGAAQIRSQLPGSPLVALQSFASNPQAGKALLRPENANIIRQWPALAQRNGVNPQDMSDYNVRLVATLEANKARAQLSLPLLPMPVGYRDVEGPYGEHSQIQMGGETPGKESEITGQKPPTFTGEKGHDIATGKDTLQMVQTSPGGMPSGLSGADRGASTGAGGVGSLQGPSIDMGYPAPSSENVKQAGFAEVFQNGLKGMRKQEANGFQLSPSMRAQLIDIAVNEDDSATHNFISQELLAHRKDPQFQSYMAAMAPVIQAASHDQSGARLNSTTIRSNLEGMIPIDVKNKDAMDIMEGTRNSFQKAMNVGAGPLAFSPEFKNTVGAQRNQMRATGTLTAPISKTVNGVSYVQRDGKWYHQ